MTPSPVTLTWYLIVKGHPERVNFQSNGQNLMVLQLWVFCLVRSLNLFTEVELKTKNEGQDKQEPLGAAPTGPVSPSPIIFTSSPGCFPNPRMAQTKTQIIFYSPLLNRSWCLQPQTWLRWCDFGRSRTGHSWLSAWKFCRLATRPVLLRDTRDFNSPALS